MEDWSELNAEELKTKLIDKKVITDRECSDGLKNICQSCIDPSLDTPSKRST
jgi:hypothetical protein